jgi:hypothetical protein
MNAIVPIPPEGLFAAFSDFSHAPLSQKPVQKRFLSPEGVSLSVKAVLQKNFLVRESISLVAPASAAVTRLAA